MSINAKRLLKLADYLETVPADRFDMTTFRTENECGFAGCALGWAAHGKIFKNFHGDEDGWTFFWLNGEKLDGFDAAERLFAIDEHTAANLFTPARLDETPSQVAERIREFVRDNSFDCTTTPDLARQEE